MHLLRFRLRLEGPLVLRMKKRQASALLWPLVCRHKLALSALRLSSRCGRLMAPLVLHGRDAAHSHDREQFYNAANSAGLPRVLMSHLKRRCSGRPHQANAAGSTWSWVVRLMPPGQRPGWQMAELDRSGRLTCSAARRASSLDACCRCASASPAADPAHVCAS